MMRKLATITFSLLLLAFFAGSNIFAQDTFSRLTEIPFPEKDLNVGGCGNMISGVDTDGDGNMEIIVVNDNWNDKPDELIPRIYKMELQNGSWVVVWKAVAPVPLQNTWPPLKLADLDKDGKLEVIWGIVNYTSDDSPNPARIVVYEAKGDGSDAMGVDDGTGTYMPNAKWTITSEDKINIRPLEFKLADPDNDGVTEIIFADRAGATGGYYFGVISVSNIPDNGDGSETWTLETSGKNFTLSATIENKWDVAVIGSNLYFFDEADISKLRWDGANWNYTTLKAMKGGSAVQSSQVVDLDGDGKMEIITAVYDWGNDANKSIMLLQEDADTLKHTELINVSSYWPSGSRGPWTSAMGDIDADGKMDFVFGSRASTPNAAIFRLEYQGGAITDPASYVLSIIDSEYKAEAAAGIWNIVNLTNLDADAHLEILYTSSTPDGDLFSNFAYPIIILDLTSTGVDKQVISVPVDFTLNQNYPNPFNPVTNISYSLNQTENVELIVFNLQGEEVKTLVNSRESAGNHVTQWDATNNLGQKVTSGAYIYTLKVGNVLQSKRMILVK